MQVLLIAFATGALQFEVKTVGEQPAPERKAGIGFLLVARQQCLADISRPGTGQSNQPFGMAFEPAFPHLGLAAMLSQIFSRRSSRSGIGS